MLIDLEKCKAYCDTRKCCDDGCALHPERGACIFSEASWDEIEAAYTKMEEEVKKNAGI